MAKENVQKDEERLEQIETTLGRTEMFIENHRKSITIIVAILVVAILAIFGVKKFVMEPRETAAANAMFHAEQLFEKDDYATALSRYQVSQRIQRHRFVRKAFGNGCYG